MSCARPQFVLLTIVLIAIGAVAVFMKWQGPEENTQIIRMAGQVGIVGELLESTGKYLAKETEGNDRSLEDIYSRKFSFLQNSDCCSATTTWGMSAKSLHGAIMCPDAARDFLKDNDEFVSVGVIMLNSDVFMQNNAEKSGEEKTTKIGISHKRQHQVMMAKSRFGPHSQVLQMLPVGLPYALEKGEVDAIVIDLGVAVELAKGDTLARINPWNHDAVPTQVLVLRKTFVESDFFTVFSLAYEQARNDLLQKYAGYGIQVNKLPENL